jgi:hypothetical protein
LARKLQNISVVAKFATTATDSKTYQMEYYNLDMILSVGYRVKSQRGIQFRIWSNRVLKDYLLKGYAINQRIERVEQKHNAQYPVINVQTFTRLHDRFIFINNEIYHIGASLKDLGKKWFAFSEIGLDINTLLQNLI